MNYYPFHVGDYAVHTRHLTLMEDLAYRRLLDLYYTREGALPSDVAQIARLIGMREHLADVESVLREFFVSGEGWSNVRCDAELARMRDKQTKAKASAQASVNARLTNAQRTLNERTTKVELPTPTPTPTPTPKENTNTPGFASFWSAYPKKTARPAAMKAFKTQKINGELPELLADIERRSGGAEWQKDGGQYIPNPATYLNQRRWEDTVSLPSGTVAGAI